MRICWLILACAVLPLAGCVYVDDYQETWRIRYGVVDQDELKKQGLTVEVSLPDVEHGKADVNNYGQVFHTFKRRYEGPNHVRVVVTQLEPGRYNELHVHGITVNEWTEGKTHTVKSLDSPTARIEFPNDPNMTRCQATFTSKDTFNPVCLDKRQMRVIVDFSVTYGTNEHGNRYYRKQLSCYALGAVHENNGLDLVD